MPFMRRVGCCETLGFAPIGASLQRASQEAMSLPYRLLVLDFTLEDEREAGRVAALHHELTG